MFRLGLGFGFGFGVTDDNQPRAITVARLNDCVGE
jgi:hypothetical protein